MQLGVLLLALAFPLLELAVLIKVGQSIGFWSTVLLLIAMALLGAILVQRQGLAAAQRAMDNLSRGEPPIGPAIDSFMIMLAGFLFLVPGLLTDVMGLVLLIPPARRFIARWLLGRMLAKGEVHVRRTEWRSGPDGDAAHPRTSRSRDDVVIEGEWHRVDDPQPPGKGIGGPGPGTSTGSGTGTGRAPDSGR